MASIMVSLIAALVVVVVVMSISEWIWIKGVEKRMSKKKDDVVASQNVFLEDELQSAANKLNRPIDRIKATMGDSTGVLLLCLSDNEVTKMVEWGVKGKNMMVSLKPGKARLSGTQIVTDAIPILTKRGKKVG